MWKKAEKKLLNDLKLRPIVQRWGKCTISKSKREIYFEELIESIVSQQLSGKAAETIYRRVRGVIKQKSPALLSPIVPSEVLTASKILLREAGLSWSKIDYINDLAGKVERGDVDLKNIDKSKDEDIIKELTKVKGIGRWTAEMFLMFTLARPDVFPIDDLGINKGMEKIYKKPMTKDEMDKLSQNWKPHRTVASWYVWRALD